MCPNHSGQQLKDDSNEGESESREEARRKGEEGSGKEEEVTSFVSSAMGVAAMSFKAFSAGVSGLLLLVTSAQAGSITNRDDRDHKITVIEGENQKDHILKPSAVLQDICPKGCLIRLNDNAEDDPYELEGSDSISIDGGELWQEKADEPAASTSGADGQTSRTAPGP